jgi:hypothetical protein
MRFAYPKQDVTDTDPLGRVLAEDHQCEVGICPLCGGEVISLLVNGEWRWKHKAGCKPERVQR